jgi:molybdenum cofactor sulfurtransferase
MALGCAIDTHKRLYGSMSAISQHTSFLSHRLYWGMRNMHHFNGNAVCTIYTDDERGYGNAKLQGGTVAFNLKDSSGGLIGHSFVEKAADEKGIFLRSGGLCNAV